MKNKLLFILLLLSCNFVNDSNAQRTCGNEGYTQEQLSNPEFIIRRDQLEKDLNEFIISGEYNKLYRLYNGLNSNARLTSSGSIISIPVVVHVIGNVSNTIVYDNLVIQQIQILNNDYRRIIGTTGNGNGADTQIEFCLATKDPDGNSTNGIVRISGNYGPYNYRVAADLTSLKSLSSWDPNSYLNVWVTELMFGQLGKGTWPSDYLGTSSEFEDGVVVNVGAFGPNSSIPTMDQGRTLTHEIGHWLNLHHPWGDAEGGCFSDGIDDTPFCSDPYQSSPLTGCQSIDQCLTENQNASLPVRRQIENYMDYSADLCMNMFTEGQKSRMLSTIFSVRSSLFSSDAGCNSNIILPAHCSNLVLDGDESGVDCGGSCPACSQSSSYYIGCTMDEHYNPYGHCIPRNRYVNIYGCLNGATNGPSRDMLADNYNVGTPNFYFTSGRVTIYADCNQDNQPNTSLIPPNSGRINLINGFKFISHGHSDEIRFIIRDLPENYAEIYANSCPSSTANPCPSNQHYRLRNDNTINYEENSNIKTTDNKILTYPNPVVGLLTIELNSAMPVSWELYDSTSRIINSGNSATDYTIDFYSYKPGIYFLKLFNNDEFYLERVVHY